MIEQATSQAPLGMPIRILFQDEARFGRISDSRRCWAPLPKRPTVKRQVVREYVYALTAVCPHDGRLSSLVMPYLDTETMSLFLKHTAETFANEFCVMLFDAAGWHKANDLYIPRTMKIISLPPYSPELNPVELIWDYIRDNFFGNTAFESLDHVIDMLCSGLKQIDEQPELIKSMTYFDWIKTLCLTSN